MITLGKLVSERGVSGVMTEVENATTVSRYLLLESEEFLAELRKAETLDEIVDWVNENY
jgi:hypothetical protein